MKLNVRANKPDDNWMIDKAKEAQNWCDEEEKIVW